MRHESRTYRLACGALLTISVFLCFFRLADGGLRNGDEARYAIVAENILHTGDWVTLHYLDEPYFQKSPARFWLSAALYRVAGSWPWSLLVLPALVHLLVSLRGGEGGRANWRRCVPWLMLGVLLLFITVSERKLAWYAIPG